MTIIWSEEAAADLEEIVGHIALDSPEAGRRVAKHVYNTIMNLVSSPHRGRKREEDSAREIILVPWPYVAVYEVIGDRLYVKAFRHTSRDRIR
jgi:plasmid stabilization system protein ParE